MLHRDTPYAMANLLLCHWQIAELIRHVIDEHRSPLPAVLEIPSKDCPYDASKDSILRRAKVSWYSDWLFVHLWIHARQQISESYEAFIQQMTGCQGYD